MTTLQKTAWCPTCNALQEIYRAAVGDSAEGALCCVRCSRVLFVESPDPGPPPDRARELALAAAEEELIQARATVAALERIVARLRGE